MWKKKVNTVLAKHAGTRQNGAAASARTMAHTGQVVYKAFSRLHEMGLKIEDPQNLSDKHIRALVRDWWLGPKRKAPKTIQNDLSRLRMFAGWIGKPNLVLTTIKYLPEVDPREFIVRTAASESKSWTSNNIDVREKILQAGNIDARFGLMLRLMLAFGLRRKEVLLCCPHKADRGTSFRIYPGEAKGGRPRDIPIDTDEQRAALDYVKARMKVSHSMGWEFTVGGERATHKYNLGRYNKLMHRIGMTRIEAGVTGHGLRAQYAENTALNESFIPATLGGTATPEQDKELLVRKLQISENLGHSRPDVTRSYYGSYGRKKKDLRPGALKTVIEAWQKDLIHVDLQPVPGTRLEVCMKIVSALAYEDIDITAKEAQMLWLAHSERLGVQWATLGPGLLECVEVAARTMEARITQLVAQGVTTPDTVVPNGQ